MLFGRFCVTEHPAARDQKHSLAYAPHVSRGGARSPATLLDYSDRLSSRRSPRIGIRNLSIRNWSDPNPRLENAENPPFPPVFVRLRTQEGSCRRTFSR